MEHLTTLDVVLITAGLLGLAAVVGSALRAVRRSLRIPHGLESQ